MKLCNDDCKPICDFCKYYKDNGLVFKGEGICLKLNREVECTDGYNCEEFYCFNLEE